jgi:hypothetical protein
MALMYRPGLAVDTCLHLLYLVTPYEMADSAQFPADLYHQVGFPLRLLSVFRILLSLSKYSKKNLDSYDSYCFVTSFGLCIFEK